MLDMTFPEFEAAVNGTDMVLLPVGSIEEHSAHLPLGTDAIEIARPRCSTCSNTCARLASRRFSAHR